MGETDGGWGHGCVSDGGWVVHVPMSALASCFPDDPPKESPHSPAKGTIRHTSTAKRLVHTVKYHREVVRALNKELEPVFKYRGKPAGESAPASLIVDLVAHMSTNISDSRVQLSKGIGAKDYGHPELYDKDPKVRYMFLISQLFDHHREQDRLAHGRDLGHEALLTRLGPEGGEIVHTKKYQPEESLQTIKGVCVIDNNGHIDVKTTISSRGLQYSDKLRLDAETERDLDSHYKERWDYINSISVNEMHMKNDKNNIEIIEDVSFSAKSFTKIIGSRMLFTVNALNRITDIPDRYRNRKSPLKISRGFKDIDEVEIRLPANFEVEALPKNKSIETKFGSYKTELEVKDENTLVYKREFVIKDGEFPKEDYSKFRDFYKEVSRQDNAKIALIKKQQ